jgi:hypothetical protein
MLAPLLALAMQLPSDQGSGSGLYADCKVYLSIADDLKGSTANDLQAGVCIGYISGFTDSVNGDHICASDATMGTIVRVYIAYMDKNPKLFDAPRAVGLDLALKDAYRCPAK